MSKNWEHKAGIVWARLVDVAKTHEVVIYSDLAPLIETGSRSVRHSLEPIQNFCLENKLPPLTVLVVNKSTRKPGEGFIAWRIDNLKEAYKQVYAFNWDTVNNPFEKFGPNDTTESFAQAIVNNPEQADDVYAQVKVRGSVQQIFRCALLDAYDSQCAMCGFGFEVALEAAHIIPWDECNKELRLSPRNGILLCANHHKLFDSGWISVTDKYEIIYKVENQSLDDYSKSDRQASVLLHGKKLRLPKDKKLSPDPELLKKRCER